MNHLKKILAPEIVNEYEAIAQAQRDQWKWLDEAQKKIDRENVTAWQKIDARGRKTEQKAIAALFRAAVDARNAVKIGQVYMAYYGTWPGARNYCIRTKATSERGIKAEIHKGHRLKSDAIAATKKAKRAGGCDLDRAIAALRREFNKKNK